VVAVSSNTRHDRPGIRQNPTGGFRTARRFPAPSGLGENAAVPRFVGRTHALALLGAAREAVVAVPPGVSRRPGFVLVSGEGGMGKTALLSRFAAALADTGALAIWGTCWDAGQAPAYWPWTQALRDLLDRRHDLLDALPAELAAIVPGLAADTEVMAAADDATARLRIFDAAGRLLDRAARGGLIVVILDDLQWSDLSTLDLLRFLIRTPVSGPLLVLGAYRPEELDIPTRTALTELATTGEAVPLDGLSLSEVTELVAGVAGAPAAEAWSADIFRRSAGHPFFTWELTNVVTSGRTASGVPSAVREVIARRIARVSTPCVRLLEAASVAGAQLWPDVLGEATGAEAAVVAHLLGEAHAAGIVTEHSSPDDPPRFTHDLYRESIYASIASGQRLELHHRLGSALARRQARGGGVFAADVARHFAAAAAVVEPESVLRWARIAADAEARRFAFAEAAEQLSRARSAVTAGGSTVDNGDLIDLLTAEADFRDRAGDATTARELLARAWRLATSGQSDPARVGAIALGLDRLGARFAMPRTDLIQALERARTDLAGSGSTMEAQVTAALARQLQHSVVRDRPRAGPLAEDAVRIARRLGDPATLASCLLAKHDVMWTPGTAAQRAAIAGEIAELAERAGDPERRTQGLLLTATALLESGSPAFRASLAEYSFAAVALRQPRHDYLVRTRAAALALLDGDITGGEELVESAYELGLRVGDSDAGNVRMSQRLEVVRARGDADELRAMAGEAARWWVGAPAHAHAVAAGFLARAGDLDGARSELDVVTALPEWRTDRSYLWSVFVGELVTAAIALDDTPLCTELLSQLEPVADTCAVNGALVCFMGSHAHRVGLLHAKLGRPDEARGWLDRALDVHRRLGARAWEAETRSARVERRAPVQERTDETGRERPTLRREGDLWLAGYRGRTAHLRHSKGMQDLAVLLARPGADVSALDLAGSTDRAAPSHAEDRGDPVLDRQALSAYRQRLSELDEELASAQQAHDLARAERAGDERERIATQLRRATRPDGTARRLGATAAERARKAVSARIREAIRRIGQAIPELGAHLDRSVRTGITCRYDP
jgi:tetratricopeptide (TPR) repeat protein